MGWTIRKSDKRTFPNTTYYAAFNSSGKRQGVWVGQASNACHGLPAIESDPAVAEQMFLEWCEKNDYYANLYYNLIGDAPIALELHRRKSPGKAVFVKGSTPSEARARAIVEMSKR